MSRTESSSPLWHLLLIDAVSVGGILGLQALVGATKMDALVWFEGAGIVGIGVATGYYWYKTVNRREGSGAGPSVESLDALRRENAENLRLLQEDLHNLGQAMMKRLPRVSDARPEGDAAVAADLAEVKSTVFEMQAQLDLMNDCLSRSIVAAAAAAPRHVIDDDAGSGASPSGLSRALTGAVTGSAVSRLIAQGAAPARPAEACAPVAATDLESAHPEGDPLPVLGGDLGTVEQAPDVAVSVDRPAGESEWGDAEFAGVDPNEPELAAFPVSTSDAQAESDLTGLEESEVDDDADWLTAGIPEEEVVVAKPAAASQPELLSLDDEAPAVSRPRRPAKGETALVAHMMIGIGNKPYLRGIGPGLSIEEGVPMEYVDVGTWQWICPESDVPVALSVWKNDEYPADGDLVEIEPGEVVEIHPKFEPQH